MGVLLHFIALFYACPPPLGKWVPLSRTMEGGSWKKDNFFHQRPIQFPPIRLLPVIHCFVPNNIPPRPQYISPRTGRIDHHSSTKFAAGGVACNKEKPILHHNIILSHHSYLSSIYHRLRHHKNSKGRTRWVYGEMISRNARETSLQRRAARGDMEWRGAAWSLTWMWISGRWCGEQCIWSGKVWERSVLMGYALLSPCYIVQPAKIDNRNGNCEQGCEGKSILKKSSLSGWSGVQVCESTS